MLQRIDDDANDDPASNSPTAYVPVSESAAELLAAECRHPIHFPLVADGACVRATAKCELVDTDGNGVGDTVVARFRGAVTIRDEDDAPDMGRPFQRRVALEAAHRIAGGPAWRHRLLICGEEPNRAA